MGALDACEPAPGELDVFLLQFETNITATGKRSCYQGAAATTDMQEDAIGLVLEQAERLSDEWTT